MRGEVFFPTTFPPDDLTNPCDAARLHEDKDGKNGKMYD
jgi:hypothetical protein